MPKAAVLPVAPSWDVIDTANDVAVRPDVRAVDPDRDAAAAVGARPLQDSLERRLSQPSSQTRWSARRTVAFVAVSSLTLWGLIIWGAAALIAGLTG
ncbi:hypothetical protein BH09PSE1_BH09PSE1_04920 [soil metagenome]